MANPFINESTRVASKTPPILIKPKTKEGVIKVLVPTSGGGFTNAEMPIGQYEYLRDLQEGNLNWRSLQSNYLKPSLWKSSLAVEIAKELLPERYADPINNAFNNLMFGGAGLYKAATNEALQGLAGTIRKWAPKMSFRSAYGNTPLATAGDAAMIAVPTGYEAGDLVQNGPTVENIVGTTLGAVGLGSEALPTIIKGVNSGKRTFDIYRLSRLLNKSSGEIVGNKLLPKTIGIETPQRSIRKLRYPFKEQNSNLTEAERIGIPKGERNNISKPVMDFGTYTTRQWQLIDAPLLGNYIGRGDEAAVFSNEDLVYKIIRNPINRTSSNLSESFKKNLIGEFVRSYINPRNKHKIFEPIHFEGIISDEYGKLFPVISQNKITPALKSEDILTIDLLKDLLNRRNSILKLLGYVQSSPDTFTNNIGAITDLHPYNLGYDSNGNLKIFDMSI